MRRTWTAMRIGGGVLLMAVAMIVMEIAALRLFTPRESFEPGAEILSLLE